MGIAAVASWALLEAALSTPFSVAGILLALLLATSFGTLLGLSIGRLSGGRLTACLLLFPAPVLYLGVIAAAIQRIAYLHFFLVHLSVWTLSLFAAGAVGFVLHRALRRRLMLRPLLDGACSLAVVILVAVLILPVLQGVCVEAAVGLGLLTSYGTLAMAIILTGRARVLWASMLALAAVVAVTVIPDRYHELQAVFSCLAVGGSFLALGTQADAFGCRARRRWHHLAYAGLVVAAIIGAHVLVMEIPAVWAGKKGPGGVTSFLVRVGQRITDFDGDHYGLLFGLRDCDLWDDQVYPSAHERPNNGKDDNCMAGDAVGDHVAWVRTQEAVNPPPPSWQGDMILITVDCLRQLSVDALDLPGFRAMEEDGVVFERAYSSSSFTPQCFLGILAARLPANIALTFATRFGGSPSRPIGGIAPMLREAGYDTAFAGGLPPEINDAFTEDNFGSGFRIHRYTSYRTPVNVVTSETLRAWRSLDDTKPRFMWVHYFNVHPQLEIDGYETAIREFDESLALLRRELGDGPLVIVTGDHGQEFGEHGGVGHSATLYEEVQRVPLIMAGGPLPRGRRVSQVSPLRSLMPTLIAMQRPELAPQGPGPYLCLGPGECHDQPVPMGIHLGSMHLHGLVLGDRKIIRDLNRSLLEAYDLLEDPEELQPLHPIPRDLEDALIAWEERGISLTGDEHVWPYGAPPSEPVDKGISGR